jgi:hypothetical protein
VYPLLFLSQGIKRLSLMCERRVITIDLQELEWSAVQAQLDMSFLGDANIYWIKNASDLNMQKRNALFAYLATYQGPHYVIVYVDVAPAAQEGICVLPESVDRAAFVNIHTFLYDNAFADQQFLDKVYARNDTIPLAAACLLMRYHEVLGRGQTAFCDTWLDLIIPPSKSLFTLSQYFFALQGATFLKEWEKVRDNYPEEFWVSFWSEQVWQATVFLQALAHKKTLLDAKKLVTRLPFSFTQKDWNNHSVAALARAHDFLYSVDYGLKNGQAQSGLELFLYKFLNKAL